ncbi:hypothetical protein CXG81DRAFT_18051 [Caulochytrium protostelioides]|uniref:DH domain-containing protein n=1 Tax=Caulochytrium protostelioides TaxID=1555241 RepID=A0A4P9XAA6_9FUNG|nr:hypothetical protein CXG81DRAFT_18051 [Caulochytrium protostelioides]|eukprot:RKP02303.1 hypothetical protein CXG81DRAFT_18051 [Caulochytrium protostelioides]
MKHAASESDVPECKSGFDSGRARLRRDSSLCLVEPIRVDAAASVAALPRGNQPNAPRRHSCPPRMLASPASPLALTRDAGSPVHLTDLLARISALLDRAGHALTRSDGAVYQSLIMDTLRYLAARDPADPEGAESARRGTGSGGGSGRRRHPMSQPPPAPAHARASMAASALPSAGAGALLGSAPPDNGRGAMAVETRRSAAPSGPPSARAFARSPVASPIASPAVSPSAPVAAAAAAEAAAAAMVPGPRSAAPLTRHASTSSAASHVSHLQSIMTILSNVLGPAVARPPAAHVGRGTGEVDHAAMARALSRLSFHLCRMASVPPAYLADASGAAAAAAPPPPPPWSEPPAAAALAAAAAAPGAMAGPRLLVARPRRSSLAAAAAGVHPIVVAPAPPAIDAMGALTTPHAPAQTPPPPPPAASPTDRPPLRHTQAARDLTRLTPSARAPPAIGADGAAPIEKLLRVLHEAIALLRASAAPPDAVDRVERRLWRSLKPLAALVAEAGVAAASAAATDPTAGASAKPRRRRESMPAPGTLAPGRLALALTPTPAPRVPAVERTTKTTQLVAMATSREGATTTTTAATAAVSPLTSLGAAAVASAPSSAGRDPVPPPLPAEARVVSCLGPSPAPSPSLAAAAAAATAASASPAPPRLETLAAIRIQAFERGRAARRRYRTLVEVQHIVGELVSTERRYVQHLDIFLYTYGQAVWHAVVEPATHGLVAAEAAGATAAAATSSGPGGRGTPRSRRDQGLADDYQAVFRHVATLLKLNRQLLEQLEARFARWHAGAGVADVVAAFAKSIRVYYHYVNDYEDTTAAWRRLAADARVQRVVRQLKADAAARGARLPDLADLLIEPVQRPPRYVLLLRELARRDARPAQQREIERAVVAMRKTVEFINERKRRYDQIKWVAARTRGSPVALADNARYLIFEGPMVEPPPPPPGGPRHAAGGGGARRAQRRSVFLTNDLLIVCADVVPQRQATYAHPPSAPSLYDPFGPASAASAAAAAPRGSLAPAPRPAPAAASPGGFGSALTATFSPGARRARAFSAAAATRDAAAAATARLAARLLTPSPSPPAATVLRGDGDGPAALGGPEGREAARRQTGREGREGRDGRRAAAEATLVAVPAASSPAASSFAPASASLAASIDTTPLVFCWALHLGNVTSFEVVTASSAAGGGAAASGRKGFTMRLGWRGVAPASGSGPPVAVEGVQILTGRGHGAYWRKCLGVLCKQAVLTHPPPPLLPPPPLGTHGGPEGSAPNTAAAAAAATAAAAAGTETAPMGDARSTGRPSLAPSGSGSTRLDSGSAPTATVLATPATAAAVAMTLSPGAESMASPPPRPTVWSVCGLIPNVEHGGGERVAWSVRQLAAWL